MTAEDAPGREGAALRAETGQGCGGQPPLAEGALPSSGMGDIVASNWGVGPTVVILKQQGPRTCGMLFNQIWSFAGSNDSGGVERLQERGRPPEGGLYGHSRQAA